MYTRKRTSRDATVTVEVKPSHPASLRPPGGSHQPRSAYTTVPSWRPGRHRQSPVPARSEAGHGHIRSRSVLRTGPRGLPVMPLTPIGEGSRGSWLWCLRCITCSPGAGHGGSSTSGSGSAVGYRVATPVLDARHQNAGRTVGSGQLTLRRCLLEQLVRLMPKGFGVAERGCEGRPSVVSQDAFGVVWDSGPYIMNKTAACVLLEAPTR